MGNSPSPSSVENSFRADRPTTLSLVNGFDVCSLVALFCSLQILVMSEGRRAKKIMTSVCKNSMNFLTLRSSDSIGLA